MFHNQTACAAPGVRRRGFTLIEMLVVLLIIAILSGMVFALMGLVGKTGDKADTVRRVEMLANAIEEFRAEYGKYPPVPTYGSSQPTYYEWPILNNGVLPPDPDGAKYGLSDADATRFLNPTTDPNDDEAKGRIFTFGLASFLVPRYEPEDKNEDMWDKVYGDSPPAPYERKGYGMAAPKVLTDPDREDRNPQWFDHNDDREDKTADRNATDRIKPYIAKAGMYRDWKRREYGGLTYHNRFMSFRDAWRQDLRYRSDPPYDSYKLWSVGPDGTDGTDDDIVVGKESM